MPKMFQRGEYPSRFEFLTYLQFRCLPLPMTRLEVFHLTIIVQHSHVLFSSSEPPADQACLDKLHYWLAMILIASAVLFTNSFRV